MITTHEEFIVDSDGRRKAVILPWEEWQEVMEALEDLEDIRAYDEVKLQPSDPLPFDMEGILLGEAWVLKRLIERRWGDLPPWAGERLGKASREELEIWADRVLEAEGLEEVLGAG